MPERSERNVSYYDKEKIIGIFNFSEQNRTACLDEQDDMYVDLITGQKLSVKSVDVPAYGFYCYKKRCKKISVKYINRVMSSDLRYILEKSWNFIMD